jgi:hypothetical protein
MSDEDSNVSVFLRGFDKRTIDRLTAAVTREWGDAPIDQREPYRTNSASRAVHAVLAELERMAPKEDGESDEGGNQNDERRR